MKKLLAAALIIGGVFFISKKSAANQESEPMTSRKKTDAVPASEIDFSQIDGFTESEFQNQLHLLDSRVVYMVAALRKKIGRLRISPAPGAIARTSGSKTTMHYAEPAAGVLSQAIDVMPLDVDLKTAYAAAMQLKAIGGVGVYPDWLPLPGLHLDLRPRKNNHIAQWAGVKENGKQIYKGVQEALA